MPEQAHKTRAVNKPISFRPSMVTRKQIDDLMRLWNENQTQVMQRCIERTWALEIERKDNHGKSTPTEI